MNGLKYKVNSLCSQQKHQTIEAFNTKEHIKKRIIEETLNTIGCRTKKSQCKNMKHNEA